METSGRVVDASSGYLSRTLHNIGALLCFGLCLGAMVARSQNATWLASPGSGDWNTAGNWTPVVVPSGTAIFGASDSTSITFSQNTVIGALQFNSGSPDYTFNLTSHSLTITGTGIVNLANQSAFSTSEASGILSFTGSSTASGASITNNGGFTKFFDSSAASTDINNISGGTQFFNGSTAGGSVIQNFDGATDFFNSSTAGSSTIFNIIGTTNFFDTSSAGDSNILNSNGVTQFADKSSAGNSSIQLDFDGETDFLDSSTAGHAVIETGVNAEVNFEGASTAANSNITADAGARTDFFDTSTAGESRITNAGSASFSDSSTAGNAVIITTSSGITQFEDTSTAGHAVMTNSSGGETEFFNSSSADHAAILNISGGSTLFADSSTAGNSTITNTNGTTEFSNSSTAGAAKITSNAGGNTLFEDSSTAGSATVTANPGGNTRFQDTSTAGLATIITNSGGRTGFYDESSGGKARFITNAGGKLDISTLFIGATTAGSIEGAGSYQLGSKKFTVGLNNLSTEVSGTITDGGAGGGKGGSLVKEGTGTLILSGTDTYTGGTTILKGTLQLGSSTRVGSIIGPVVNTCTFTLFNANTSGITSITNNDNGNTLFQNTSTAGKITITTNSGGATRFYDKSTGGDARFITNAGGKVDISTLFVGAITAGSIEGAGSYLLGSKKFTVGLNNLSTEVSGTIADGGAGSGKGGSLIKVGRGTLTLSGADTYTGGTTISAGTLQLGSSTRIGSILGSVLNSGTFTLFNADTSGITSITNNAGGATRFQNTTTAGTAIITTNSGGTTRFYDKSTGGDARFITNAGGRVDISTLFIGATTAGSIEGAGSYLLGKKRFTVGLNNLSTEVSGTIADGGAGSGTGGSLIKVGSGTLTLSGADTYTGGTTILAGTLQLGSSTGTGSIVGAVINNSIFDIFKADTDGITGITNNGSGQTIFENNSTAGFLRDVNAGGLTRFSGTSTAGSSFIFNNSGGSTQFSQTSTAGNAQLTNNSGLTQFADMSTAGSALITNNLGGKTNFFNSSTAADSTINNNSNSGVTQFNDSSTAAEANITNTNGGVTHFFNTSTAGNATILNTSISTQGPELPNGSTLFSQTSTAGASNITNTGGGDVEFFNKSNAGSATINNIFGGVQFSDSSAAATALITNQLSGSIGFIDGSTARAATINNDGGFIGFYSNATAGNATITNNFNGVMQFSLSSKAGSANITNNGGSITNFYNTTSADTSTMTNNGGQTIFHSGSTAANSRITISNGGSVEFDDSSTAGNSAIAITVNGGFINFAGTSTAANSTIMTGEGATQFLETSTAGNATIITHAFGNTGFFDNSAGGQARFITEAGGIVDISFLRTATMTAGSIEGAGAYYLGSKELIVGSNNLSTLVSGSINDGGRNGGMGAILTKVGTGTLTLTGPNTYSGGTNLDGGTVAVNGNQNLGTGPVNFNGGKLLVLGLGQVFTSSNSMILNGGGNSVSVDTGTVSKFSAAISGAGSLTKEGPGTLALSSANVYSGGTVIDLGTLIVDNPQALGTGDVFVRGGVLMSDPQTINVVGNYAQSAAGTLQLEVAGANPGQYDSLNVGGNAALGGTLQLVSLGFQPKAGNQLTLVTAGGLVSGRFANFVDPFATGPGFNTVDLVYGRNSVLLEFLNQAHPGAPFVVTTNFSSFVMAPAELPAASLLDAVQLDPKVAGLISFLNNEPFANLPGDFEKISPEALSAFYEIGFSNANIQRLNLESRLDDLRSGSNGFNSNMKVNGATVNLQSGSSADGKSSKSVVEPVLQHTPENHWGVWATGFGDFVSVDSDGGAQGYNFTTGGVSLGLDYRITDSLAIGVMGDYSHTWTSLQPSGHIDVDSGRGGLYATWYSHGFYLNGAIYGGHNNYDSSRAGLGGLATGGTEGSEWSTFASGGYDFHFGALTAGPLASLQYTSVHIDGFSEKGSLAPLAIHSDSAESLRSDVGFRLFYQWQIGKVVLEPSLKAAWEHEYKYSALPITAGFAGIPGPSSTFSGPSEGHDSAVVSAGISVQWTPAIATYVNYDGQLGRDNYSSNAVTGGIRIGF